MRTPSQSTLIDAVSSSAELEQALARMDISVPARTQGRTSEHTEVWTICRLLATLSKAGELRFPLTLLHRDRPDFSIKLGTSCVGVETTESISRQYAAYCALAEREFPDALLELDHFRWGAPERTPDELRALLRQDRLTGDGWAGETPEKQWALFVLSAIDAKLEKLGSPTFGRFEQNWLSIYDNLPLPNVDLGRAIAYLRPLLQERWIRIPTFDVVFAERGPVVACITRYGSRHLLLNDLWE